MGLIWVLKNGQFNVHKNMCPLWTKNTKNGTKNTKNYKNGFKWATNLAKNFVTKKFNEMEGIEIGKQSRLVCFQSLFQLVNSVSHDHTTMAPRQEIFQI